MTAAAAVRRIAPLAPTLIDLNCGCSVPKVASTGCGASLMRNPGLIGSIVAAMRAETDIPATVKLRSGWDGGALNYLACAEEAWGLARARHSPRPNEDPGIHRGRRGRST